MLTTMQYKSFCWPNNPANYAISYRREAPVLKFPGGLYQIQDMGRTCRVMTGSGEFYGPKAYDTFKALAVVFYEQKPGVLIHPIWQCASVYFTKLQLLQEPRRDFVAYSFEFLETADAIPTVLQRVDTAARAHVLIVQPGQTVWSICRENNMTMGEFLKYNPTIANPAQLQPGQKVVVPG